MVHGCWGETPPLPSARCPSTRVAKAGGVQKTRWWSRSAGTLPGSGGGIQTRRLRPSEVAFASRRRPADEQTKPLVRQGLHLSLPSGICRCARRDLECGAHRLAGRVSGYRPNSGPSKSPSGLRFMPQDWQPPGCNRTTNSWESTPRGWKAYKTLHLASASKWPLFVRGSRLWASSFGRLAAQSRRDGPRIQPGDLCVTSVKGDLGTSERASGTNPLDRRWFQREVKVTSRPLVLAGKTMMQPMSTSQCKGLMWLSQMDHRRASQPGWCAESNLTENAVMANRPKHLVWAGSGTPACTAVLRHCPDTGLVSKSHAATREMSLLFSGGSWGMSGMPMQRAFSMLRFLTLGRTCA